MDDVAFLRGRLRKPLESFSIVITPKNIPESCVSIANILVGMLEKGNQESSRTSQNT